MKQVFTIILVFILVNSFAACCNTCPASAYAKGGFEASPAWGKLDIRFQDAWKEANQKKTRSRSFECMLRLTGTPLPREKEALAGAGFKARSFIKKIVTGSVAARDVPAVAELPFVEVMELAVPVTGKH